MRKRFVEVNNYVANNPILKKEPLKNQIMRVLFHAYKKIRILSSKWYPLRSWRETAKHNLSAGL